MSINTIKGIIFIGSGILLFILMSFLSSFILDELFGYEKVSIVCRDGWHSNSDTTTGACSHHGGIKSRKNNNLVKDFVRIIFLFINIVLSLFIAFCVSSFISDRLDKWIWGNIPFCKMHKDVRMRKRNGRYGAFWGCPKYPYCKFTINIEKEKSEVDNL